MSLEEGSKVNNPDYTKHHPEAIQDPNVALDVAKATQRTEEYLQNLGQQALDAALAGRVEDANAVLRSMEERKAGMEAATQFIIDTHRKVTEILNHGTPPTTVSTE